SKTGKVLTVLLSSHPVTIEGELHFLSAGVDISARKEAEARLVESERRFRESEARFSTAFRTSPLLMTIARLEDARFVEVNPAFVNMLGLKREDVIGQDSLGLDLWLDREARASFFQRLKQERVMSNLECQMRGREGLIHTMQLSA